MTQPEALAALVADGHVPADDETANAAPDAREWIREITFVLACGGRIVEPPEVTAALDAYRDQVLTEAAELLVAEMPWHRLCADVLLAARSAQTPQGS